MEFGSQADQPRGNERRQTKRRPAFATCGLRGPDGIASSVTLWNISEGGFGAQCTASVRDGDQVTFRLGRAGHAKARVIWRNGQVVGCAFLRPVSPAEVALALATASPALPDEDKADDR
jgi:hypothetical protein